MVNGGSKVVVSVILRLAAGVWPLRYRDPDALPLIIRRATTLHHQYDLSCILDSISFRSGHECDGFRVLLPANGAAPELWLEAVYSTMHSQRGKVHACMARWRGCDKCRTMFSFSLTTLILTQLSKTSFKSSDSCQYRNHRPKTL